MWEACVTKVVDSLCSPGICSKYFTYVFTSARFQPLQRLISVIISGHGRVKSVEPEVFYWK